MSSLKLSTFLSENGGGMGAVVIGGDPVGVLNTNARSSEALDDCESLLAATFGVIESTITMLFPKDPGKQAAAKFRISLAAMVRSANCDSYGTVGPAIKLGDPRYRGPR